jgi:hypothetical protein
VVALILYGFAALEQIVFQVSIMGIHATQYPLSSPPMIVNKSHGNIMFFIIHKFDIKIDFFSAITGDGSILNISATSVIKLAVGIYDHHHLCRDANKIK